MRGRRAPRPVTKKALADERGCHRSQVTRATAKGGILHKALLPGGRVDRGHPAVENWMAMAVLGSDDGETDSEETDDSRPGAPTSPGKPGRNRSGEPTGSPDLFKDENGFFPGLYAYTHKEIADRFATFTAVADIVDLHYKTEQARKLWLANEVAEGNLIERQRVLTHALGMFDAAFKKLLSDAAKTMALRSISMIKSGCTAEELEQFIRDAQSSVLRPARDAAVKNLRKQKKPRETESSGNDEQ